MYRSDELRHIVQEKLDRAHNEYVVFKIIDNDPIDSFERKIGVSRVRKEYINSSSLDQIIRDEFYKMRGIDISDSKRFEILYDDVSFEIDDYPPGINLEDYVWDDKLKEHVFNIKLNSDFEDKLSTMKEVYEGGYNEGHCGLTSRYLARSDDSIELPYRDATCSLLKGTYGSDYGNHCWCFKGDYIIDTTLMIIIPIELAKKIGYSWNNLIMHESSRYLSSGDTFSSEVDKYERYKYKRTK